MVSNATVRENPRNPERHPARPSLCPGHGVAAEEPTVRSRAHAFKEGEVSARGAASREARPRPSARVVDTSHHGNNVLLRPSPQPALRGIGTVQSESSDFQVHTRPETGKTGPATDLAECVTAPGTGGGVRARL